MWLVAFDIGVDGEDQDTSVRLASALHRARWPGSEHTLAAPASTAAGHVGGVDRLLAYWWPAGQREPALRGYRLSADTSMEAHVETTRMNISAYVCDMSPIEG